MAQLIKVGIADLNVAVAPDSLISYALGSCVGICLYDRITKVAGLSHVLLPINENNDKNLMKYANTAIPMLVDMMIKRGASRARLKAKIAGGAKMFEGLRDGPASQIGVRNVLATKGALSKLAIPIIAEDTGGNYGRTIEFSAETGILLVKSVSKETKEL